MADRITCRDHTAAEALIDAMVGWTAVGADSDGNEVSRKTSPEVRAHLDAVLGDACMNYGGDTKPGRREAMAAYLRSVADLLAGPVEKASAAASDVLAERRRQIGVEGWTADHDDDHEDGEMAGAAAAYTMHAIAQINGVTPDEPPNFWPWAPEWWKPASPRRNLEKAGALIIAEMERLDRAEARNAP